MKLKLSKTSWLLLSAGIFVVVLAGLGVTRSQQLKEQTQLEEELTLSTMKVDTIQVSHLRPQLDELQQRLDESITQLSEVQDRLRQTVLSVDIAEKYFAIAEYCDVVISNISTTTISTASIGGIAVSSASIGASVSGELDNIIDFLIGLNEGYTTGYVQSVQIGIPDESTDTLPSASFQMVIFSYEG